MYSEHQSIETSFDRYGDIGAQYNPKIVGSYMQIRHNKCGDQDSTEGGWIHYENLDNKVPS